MRIWNRLGILAVALGLATGGTHVAHGDDGDPPATPRPATCGPTDKPEGAMQGRVPASDVSSGRAAQGYTCNTELVGHFGEAFFPGGAGGFRTYRYHDGRHECAYYDSTLLYPLNATTQKHNLNGVYVLDMSDSSAPVKTANLLTPAMQSPHESLSLNERKGWLAAAHGNPTTGPGVVDIYDLTEDCRYPKLLSSTPFGVLGHEGTFSPDGDTFWVTSTQASLITALDVSDPLLPRILFMTRAYRPHGLNISENGNTLYLADTTSGRSGMTVLDVTQVQNRTPNPVVTETRHVTWDTVSIPQTAIPITIGARPLVLEIDEYARGLAAGNPSAPVGAGRIIDLALATNPVISDLRLEVHQRANIAGIAGDPGASFQLQGYAGHYCSVPTRVNPKIAACSMIASGLRVFDIRDPENPREIAYFNAPVPPAPPGTPGGNFAMSAPAFALDRGEIWYTDGNSGFYAVRLTNGVWPLA